MIVGMRLLPLFSRALTWVKKNPSFLLELRDELNIKKNNKTVKYTNKYKKIILDQKKKELIILKNKKNILNKKKELISMKKILNENVMELVILLKKRNLYVENIQVPPFDLEEEINFLLEKKYFDPRKILRKDFLMKKTEELTEKEIEELKILNETEEDYKKRHILKGFKELIKNTIGENKDLKVNKITKIQKNRSSIEFNFVPLVMNKLVREVSRIEDEEIPSSVIYVSIEEFDTSINNRKMLKIQFLSLIFDEIKNDFARHLWEVTYEIINKEIATNVLNENMASQLL